MPDDEDRGPSPDPWDEIVAEGLGDDLAEETLLFEGPADESAPPVEPPSDVDRLEAGSDVFAAAADTGPGEAEDASVEAWLSGDDGESDAEAPALSVFAPEEVATGLSGVDIGTGASGIAQDGAAAEMGDEQVGADAFAAMSIAADSGVDDWGGVEPPPAADATTGDDDWNAFDVAAGAVTAAAAATRDIDAATGRRAPSPARKSGGLGHLMGIVLGGLLAIPVALAILLFGFGQDPLGLATLVPSQAAFLLPAKLRPAQPQPMAAVAAATVDTAPLGEIPAEPAVPDPAMSEPVASEPVASEPVASEPVASEPVASEPIASEPIASEPIASEPIASEPVSVAVTPEPAEPVDMTVVDAVVTVDPQPAPEPEPVPVAPPMPIPSAEPPMDAVAVAAPGLDALVVEPPAIPPPAPQPAPLDTAALDEAVGEAAELGEALGAADDRGDRAYSLLRTRWYRSLARVAEELVALEHAAVAAGRPLDAMPENVAVLHGAIGGRESLVAELAALAPDWLAYAKRGSDGVVLPVTFESARKVGPYWTARATLTDAAGRPRTVTLISRTEPVAVAGDALVVTGVALDGGVIWAADVRGATADGAAAPGF